MTASGWSIEESDEEWKQYDVTNSSEASSNDHFFVPVKIALLYKDIEKDRTIPLTCSCPRVGVRENNMTSPTSGQTMTMESITIEKQSEQQKQQTENMDTSKVYEAFEFDDDSDKGPASAKRKTPANGVKRPKKEKATLSNVVNDIRRQKLLDDMEANKSANVAETPEPINTK